MEFFNALFEHPAGIPLLIATWLFVMCYGGIRFGLRGLLPVLLTTILGVGVFFYARSQDNLWSGVGILALCLVVAIPLHAIALILVFSDSILGFHVKKSYNVAFLKMMRAGGIIVPILYFGFHLVFLVSQEGGSQRIGLIIDGDLAEIKKTFSSRRSVTSILDKDRDTPLHIASYWARPEVVEWFLVQGADPNAINRESKTPFKELFGNYEHFADFSVGGIHPEYVAKIAATAMLLLSSGAHLDDEDYSKLMSVPGSDSMAEVAFERITAITPFDTSALFSLANSAASYGRIGPLARIHDEMPGLLQSGSLGAQLFERSLMNDDFKLTRTMLGWGFLDGVNCCPPDFSGKGTSGPGCIDCCEMLDGNGKIPLELFKGIERRMGKFFPICPDESIGLLYRASMDTNRQLIDYLLRNHADSPEFWPACSRWMDSDDEQIREMFLKWKERVKL